MGHQQCRIGSRQKRLSLPRHIHGLVITGPTASGKSHFAFSLAQRINGMIINADAMQVYRDIPVLSDAPTTGMRTKIPHRLYGFVDARRAFSAEDWRLCALCAIKQAHRHGYMPILVGGSGLYLKALFQGLDMIPPIPAPIRQKVRATARTTDMNAWHDALKAIDPLSAARIHPHDRQRLTRAWEVFLASGTPLSTWQKNKGRTHPQQQRHVLRHNWQRHNWQRHNWQRHNWQRHNWHVIQFFPPRSVLYQRCDKRVQHMMSAGALHDVRRLYAQNIDPQCPAMKALGVRPLMDVLEKRLSTPQAQAIIQRDTRHYAKRQYVWLKTQGLKPSIIIRHIPQTILTCHVSQWCRVLLTRRLSPQHPIQL